VPGRPPIVRSTIAGYIVLIFDDIDGRHPVLALAHPMPASEPQNSATPICAIPGCSLMYLADTSGGLRVYPAGDLGVTALRVGGSSPPLS